MSPSQIHTSGLHSMIGFQSGCGLYSRLQEPNAIRVTGWPGLSSANALAETENRRETGVAFRRIR